MKRAFGIRGAYSLNLEKNESQVTHNLFANIGKSSFGVGLQTSSERKESYTSVVSTFHTHISDQAIFYTRFQKTTKPYEASMLASGVHLELNSLSLSTEMQVNQKSEFVVLFRIGLHDFLSFGTSILAS